MIKINDNILLLDNNQICFEFNIQQIIVFENTIVVRIGSEENENNVIALDMNGHEIWKINDILKINQVGNFMELEKVSEKVLGAYYIWGIYFEIDIEQKKVINKEYTR